MPAEEDGGEAAQDNIVGEEDKAGTAQVTN
jgi:hypothetical protein